LRDQLQDFSNKQPVKGTILLSTEGINVSMAGEEAAIRAFQTFLKNDQRFADITFHETYSDQIPFKHFKVKLKKEIITFKQPDADPLQQRAPALSPQDFKKWLDENRDITILDTRNDYEVRFGTFKNAVNLHLADFSELADAMDDLPKEKPLVMFCTGGIRCEKAAVHFLNHGFKDVYQLDGGILGYFKEVGGAHYHGECFIFDERVAVDTQLVQSHTRQCIACQGPIHSNADANNKNTCSSCALTFTTH
jgi:UPF0176 protein